MECTCSRAWAGTQSTIGSVPDYHCLIAVKPYTFPDPERCLSYNDMPLGGWDMFSLGE